MIVMQGETLWSPAPQPMDDYDDDEWSGVDTPFDINKRKQLVRHRIFSMGIFYWFFEDFAHVRSAFL